MYEINNFCFTYPDSEKRVLSEINLKINKGEFVVICGATGSGKSTLLRNLKPILAPNGIKEGSIVFNEKELDELEEREQVEKIGFVFQNPDNQIVTDKVWHELAFGLESLGYDNKKIRLRVAEIATFFGIQSYFNSDVNTLSGGQKQLVNLAAAMVMKPDVLILDEPTSQLDVIATNEFFNVLKRINDEFGITIILTEHRLDEVISIADRVVVLEEGTVIIDTVPESLANEWDNSEMLPNLFKIYKELKGDGVCPVTINEGKRYFNNIISKGNIETKKIEVKELEKSNVVLEAKNISYAYEKNKEIINNVSMNFEEKKIYAIVGGNGAGKSTFLSLIGGVNKPDRGKVLTKAKRMILPQNPQLLFTEKSVREELEIVNNPSKVEEIINKLELDTILERHPFDLSGGEMQRVALAKLLLLEPDILVLDEPTKGLDNVFKSKLGEILKALDITIIMASHDIEFCVKYADVCSMFFDGEVITQDISNRFFAGNTFYTTVGSRISADIFDNAVKVEDVIELCKKNKIIK